MTTVLITGASSGIGEATARAYASQGADLILVARREERLRQLQAEIQQSAARHGAKIGCEVHAMDLSQPGSAPALAAMPFASAVDILVNNAGLAAGLDLAHQAQLEDWMTMLRINIEGLVRLTHALLPKMVARRTGHIVNIGSVAGSYPYPKGNFYGASKAFVDMFSQNLRSDLHGTGLRVTNIEPGMVDTEFSLVRFAGDQQRADAVYANTTPLTAADIAETIVWSTSRPKHVNISSMEIFPTEQSLAGFAVARS